MSNIRIALAAFVAVLSLTGAVAAAELADGEVRKVDKENKKLTIKHGPLTDLEMPGMTMVFGVKEDALLDKVKTGEKIRFQAEKIDGKFVVTAIEPAP